MFIVGFLGLTFLITSGCILYFKYFKRTRPAAAASAPAATHRPSSSASRHTTARQTKSASAYTIDITNADGMNANSTTVRSAVASSLSLAARCQMPIVAMSPATSETTQPMSTGEQSQRRRERRGPRSGIRGRTRCCSARRRRTPPGRTTGIPRGRSTGTSRRPSARRPNRAIPSRPARSRRP